MSCKIHAETVERQMERNWPEGIKKTKQRLDIYHILADAVKPLTATEIYEELSKKEGGNDPPSFVILYR